MDEWIPGSRQEARPQVRNCAPGNDEGEDASMCGLLVRCCVDGRKPIHSALAQQPHRGTRGFAEHGREHVSAGRLAPQVRTMELFSYFRKFCLTRTPTQLFNARVPPDKRGVRTSRTRGGMRWPLIMRKTNACEADGEVVWS